MTLQLLFWILMILWAVTGWGAHWGPQDRRSYWAFGGNLLFFVLFLILGWKVFGAPLKG